MIHHHPAIFVDNTDYKGRGVFAKDFIPSNTIIECAPVIVLAPSETALIHETMLHDYYFSWGEDQKSSAIALGYVSIFNHDKQSNCSYVADFEDNTITIRTIEDIPAGSELTINYNLDNFSDKKLWFEVK